MLALQVAVNRRPQLTILFANCNDWVKATKLRDQSSSTCLDVSTPPSHRSRREKKCDISVAENLCLSSSRLWMDFCKFANRINFPLLCSVIISKLKKTYFIFLKYLQKHISHKFRALLIFSHLRPFLRSNANWLFINDSLLGTKKLPLGGFRIQMS